MARKAVGKTQSAYRMRLDDLECDHEGCGRLGDVCIVYSTDADVFFHQYWCDEHEKALPPGSPVFEAEGEWVPTDPEDEVN